MVHLEELLKMCVARDASDLHISVGVPPVLRIYGKLVFTDYPPLTREDTERLIYNELLNEDQRERFLKELELDFSYFVKDLSRFRVNVHMQRGHVEASFRAVPLKIRSIEELNLPPIVADLARRPDGLIIITGPTGHGKTTTMASMIDLINNERECVIISIEDPIEYLHSPNKSIIKQRGILTDTKSFGTALRYALRQDPDVICVGEMRDLETISATLTAAETGHLVITTLHTHDTTSTINRIIDVFPPTQQQQVRSQLAECLQGIIAQRLLPRIDKEGRIVATEVLLGTPAVRNVIREHKTEQIYTLIQTGVTQGMHLMDTSLRLLYRRGIISHASAIGVARNPQEIR